MFNPTSIIGQWAGHFEYGAGYGHIAGEKVEFRLYIDLFIDGQFSGTSADLEGIGSNFEIAKIKGFVGNDFVSFTKEYPHFHGFDDDGNIYADVSKQHPIIFYEGYYHSDAKRFVGIWEMETLVEETEGEQWVQLNSGKFEIWKDD